MNIFFIYWLLRPDEGAPPHDGYPSAPNAALADLQKSVPPWITLKLFHNTFSDSTVCIVVMSSALLQSFPRLVVWHAHIFRERRVARHSRSISWTHSTQIASSEVPLDRPYLRAQWSLWPLCRPNSLTKHKICPPPSPRSQCPLQRHWNRLRKSLESRSWGLEWSKRWRIDFDLSGS